MRSRLSIYIKRRSAPIMALKVRGPHIQDLPRRTGQLLRVHFRSKLVVKSAVMIGANEIYSKEKVKIIHQLGT